MILGFFNRRFFEKDFTTTDVKCSVAAVNSLAVLLYTLKTWAQLFNTNDIVS